MRHWPALEEASPHCINFRAERNPVSDVMGLISKPSGHVPYCCHGESRQRSCPHQNAALCTLSRSLPLSLSVFFSPVSACLLFILSLAIHFSLIHFYSKFCLSLFCSVSTIMDTSVCQRCPLCLLSPKTTPRTQKCLFSQHVVAEYLYINNSFVSFPSVLN